jgi:hypothetical protein
MTEEEKLNLERGIAFINYKHKIMRKKVPKGKRKRLDRRRDKMILEFKNNINDFTKTVNKTEIIKRSYKGEIFYKKN